MTRLLLSAAAAALAFCGVAEAQSRVLILSSRDEAAYNRAFNQAERGDWAGAHAALKGVSDTSLKQHVEARALLAVKYKKRQPKAVAARFVSFLSNYRDGIYAQAVYQHAVALKLKRLPEPLQTRGRIPNEEARGSGERADEVGMLFGNGDFTGARAAAESLLPTPAHAAAAWWLGLLSWRDGAMDDAQRWFADAVAAGNFGPWERAGAHYWRARALIALGKPDEAIAALKLAAATPATFYGQLAEAQLGRDSALSFAVPAMGQDDALAFTKRFPAAHRAAALAQLGLLSDAERELAAVHNRSTPDDDKAQLAFAAALDAPAAQLRVAEYGGPEVAAGYCPASSFAPDDGFRFDRALLYAIVRQESRFSPVAVSRANARGLMQVLPSTARDLGAFRTASLHDPGVNMRLGQAYIEWLGSDARAGQDLARIFAAYNGGPNWIARWEAAYPRTEDPLLWLESLPKSQSRDYAERVLSHMALCRKRLGQPPVELLAMAGGHPAIYRALDGRSASQSAPSSTSGNGAP